MIFARSVLICPRRGSARKPTKPCSHTSRGRLSRANLKPTHARLGRADRVLPGPRRAQRAPGALLRAPGRSRAQEHAGGAPVGPLGPD